MKDPDSILTRIINTDKIIKTERLLLRDLKESDHDKN